MKLFEKNPRLFYALTPIGIGLVFGLAEASSADDTFAVLAPSLIRPTIYAILIWLLMYPVMAVVNSAFQNKKVPLIARQIIACLFGAIPLAVIFAWLHNYTESDSGTNHLIWMSIAEYDDLLLDRYFKVLIAISPLWILLTYRWYWQRELTDTHEEISVDDSPTEEERAEPPSETPTQLQPPVPAFIEKMTKPIGREPWVIKAEQHYIRIYTEKGDELILYRFSDAIKGLEAFNGLQVHRSYWVAIEAIQSVTAQGNSLVLKMKNDIEVPVSRSYKKQVESLGLH